MSELLNNSEYRKKVFKEMVLKLHQGENPEEVKKDLRALLDKIPSGEVVQVEQELINEGKLRPEEITSLCDIHSQVLTGVVDATTASKIAPGHPADILLAENKEIRFLALQITEHLEAYRTKKGISDKEKNTLAAQLNLLSDIDKHYRIKEYLLFPYLEKYGITGPSQVMWAKDDEVRKFLKEAQNTIASPHFQNDFLSLVDERLLPALRAVEEMVGKENEILIPMAMDTLTPEEWYDLYQQIPEIGYTIKAPTVKWEPGDLAPKAAKSKEGDRITLDSGSFTPKELTAILNSLPIDITFVDKENKVRYFSQGKERIFDRNKSIIGRDVRNCHPPASINIVEKIVEDFKSGKEEHAPFWITMGGKFISIEYFALRDEKSDYLGTLEVSQDLTGKRALQGEQRLLHYQSESKKVETTEIVPKMKMSALLKNYPFLIEKMATLSPKYEKRWSRQRRRSILENGYHKGK